MISLLSVVCLQSALVGVNVDLKIDVDLQLRGDYSHTPFISGPDATPILNAGGSSFASQSATFDFETIFSPAGLLTVKMRNFQLQFGYSPRLYIDTTGFSDGQGLQLFHRINLDMQIGNQSEALLTTGVLASLGGIDYTQGGQVLSEFSGTTRSSASSSALDFFTITGYAKLEVPFGRNWKFTSTNTVTRFDSSADGASNLLAPNPTNASGQQTLSGPTASPPLQSMDTLSTKEEFSYKINDMHTVRADGLFSINSFPATQSFTGITPTVGWTYQISKLTRLDLDVGFLKYWVNPYPGVYGQAQYMVVGTLNLDHKFADIGLPRLTGRLAIGEAPYYDILYGDMDRRGTASAELLYDFDHQWQGSIQVRDYTELYFDGVHFIPIPKGRDLNVAIVTLQLKYKYSSWLSYTGGIYGLNEQIQPVATANYKALQDAYVFIGVTGTYDIK